MTDDERDELFDEIDKEAAMTDHAKLLAELVEANGKRTPGEWHARRAAGDWGMPFSYPHTMVIGPDGEKERGIK